MAHFYICRHGQTEFNKQKRLQGWLDSPLTEQGLGNIAMVASKIAAKNIHPDFIYTSDLGRSYTTGQTLARALNYNGEVIQLPGLREKNYGVMAGLLVPEAENLYPEYHKSPTFIPPGGESPADIKNRVVGTVISIAEETTGRTSLLAVHDGTIKAIWAAATEEDPRFVNMRPEFTHDFVGEFDVKNDKILAFKELA